MRAINALPRDSGAVRSCPADAKSATLGFGQADGNFVLVRVHSGCDRVVVEDHPALSGNPGLRSLLYAIPPPGTCADPWRCPQR